jgi:hypothetical protein
MAESRVLEIKRKREGIWERKLLPLSEGGKC